MAKLRLAQPQDRHHILRMAKAMHEESPRYKGLAFSDGKTLALIDYLMDYSEGVLIVAEQDEEIAGMIAGMLVEHFFSDAKHASDLALYVVPHRRGSSIAVRLAKAFETWAAAIGADEIILGASTGVASDRTVCMYEKLGYSLISRSLLKTKDSVNV